MEPSPALNVTATRKETYFTAILDAEGICSYAGSAVETILNYRTGKLVGHMFFHYVHEQDTASLLNLLQQLTDGEIRNQALSLRLQHENGEWLKFNVMANSISANQVVLELSARSDGDTSFEAAPADPTEEDDYSSQFKLLYYNHPDAVFTMDALGFITDLNLEASRISGYTAEDIRDKHYSFFLTSKFLEKSIHAFHKALSGVALTFTTKIRSKHKGMLFISITLVPVLENGKARSVQGIAKDITDLKKADKLVKKQAIRLENILESMEEPFFALDKQFRVSYANSGFAEFLNLKKSNIHKQNIWHLIPEAKNTKFYDKCLRVAKYRISTKFILYVPSRNGTLHFNIYPYDKGIAVHFKDVTAQKAAQDELKKLSLVASTITNAVVITNKYSQIEWVNSAFTRLTGFTLDEIKGKVPVSFLRGPETDKETENHFKQLSDLGIPFSHEAVGYTKNNEKFWHSISISPIHNDKGEVDYLIAVHTDITDRKLAEDKLVELTENLFYQNQDLQQFTYIVSHNLRAPVANILGLTSILNRMNTSSEQYTQTLENLTLSARRLDTVIKDLNLILSVKNAERSEQLEPVNLESVCHDVIQSIEQSYSPDLYCIELDMEEDACTILGRRAYLYSILHNLLNNAVKYRKEAVPLVVYVKSKVVADSVCVQVQDNGSGMDLEKVGSNIFKLYKRFHPNIAGKGIGLYLVKTQVEALGGRVEVQSKVGEGTQFSIYFKMHQQS
ncbi:PAS domain S-box protein [Pontibacter sp. SGAir0037]|uniref:PAS domain S-box protein n=1 Tax=Pontibacter sp. SGAir0037 TaxID=2571030 RepID=UPI0010CD4044|nr:PAS domain S-box protein [Pontibacter sp. SGAir0037]QCR21452.1 hypothetical protein C1N53_03195 [Pontibacter sp. SGAir0037]